MYGNSDGQEISPETLWILLILYLIFVACIFLNNIRRHFNKQRLKQEQIELGIEISRLRKELAQSRSELVDLLEKKRR